MALIPPHNTLLKIDSIKDNIEYQKQSNNTQLKPLFINNFSIIPINNNFFLNNSKEDTSNLSEIKNNLFQNNQASQIKSSFKNNTINNTMNSSEDIISYKTNHDSLFNIDVLKNSKNNIETTTKLIKPQFYKESSIKSNNSINANKALININNNPLSLKIKQNIKYKGKKIFNKFKISHIIESKKNYQINYQKI